MHVRKTLTSVVAATMVLAALPAAALAQDDQWELEEVNWSLSIIGGADSIAVPVEAGATLYLDDGVANGNTGCNSFSTTYELDGEFITFAEEMAVTQAACEGQAGEIEAAYLAALPTVVGWGIDNFNELSMLDGGQGVALVFGELAPDLGSPAFDPASLDAWDQDEALLAYQALENTLLAMGVLGDDVDDAIEFLRGDDMDDADGDDMDDADDMDDDDGDDD